MRTTIKTALLVLATLLSACVTDEDTTEPTTEDPTETAPEDDQTTTEDPTESVPAPTCERGDHSCLPSCNEACEPTEARTVWLECGQYAYTICRPSYEYCLEPQ